MKVSMRIATLPVATLALTVSFLISLAAAQDSSFHNAPASAKQMKNPYGSEPPSAGKPLYHLRCARCHGENGEGSGNIPPLAQEKIKAATPGELFWFITQGDVNNGMPSWKTLPQRQRWLIVNYARTLGSPQVAAAPAPPKPAAPAKSARLNAPPPTPPFTDFRYEKPGKIRKITLKDLPAPFATPSAPNGPRVAARPEGAWPQVPAGFKVDEYATGLEGPRIIRTAPNGDLFVAETKAGNVKVFRGISSGGKPQQMSMFASGLNEPFGITSRAP